MSEQDEEVDLKDLVLGKLENTAFLRNIRVSFEFYYLFLNEFLIILDV